MIRVRYRHGVVGETRRVVHAASAASDDATVRTVCGATLSIGEIEIVEHGGMPCMQCTARAALAAAEKDLVTELPSGAIFEEP